MDDLLVNILTELNHVTYLPIAATAVIFLTQLTKLLYNRFVPAAQIDYGNVAMIWQLVLWLLFLVAQQRGAALRFEPLIQFIGDVGLTVLGLFGSSVLGQVFYQQAKKRGTPGTRASGAGQSPPLEAPAN
jgi:hypothetical protein